VHSGIVGRYVLPSIRAATKSLDVVSPYISPEYARLLTSLAEHGVIVRVITSDANGQRHRQALNILGQQAGAYVLGIQFWPYFVLALILGVFGILLGSYPGILLIVVAGVIVVAGLVTNLTKKTGNIPLYVKVIPTAQLVHVKLYIVDQQVALVGSANLTYYGMNRNVERIEVKTSPSEVQPETVVFASLWGSHQTPTMHALSPPQAQRIPNNGTVLTREEAETLERLYGKKKPP
jgi:phosphatidylserine/phosphatidylglycerophosphate/cardiolipin synthase-like enzyme